jgi:hypothetical protein
VVLTHVEVYDSSEAVEAKDSGAEQDVEEMYSFIAQQKCRKKILESRIRLCKLFMY